MMELYIVVAQIMLMALAEAGAFRAQRRGRDAGTIALLYVHDSIASLLLALFMLRWMGII